MNINILISKMVRFFRLTARDNEPKWNKTKRTLYSVYCTMQDGIKYKEDNSVHIKFA